MVETLCNKLTLRIRKKMPEIDDERAEVINYGLQLAIGEVPKTFIVLFLAWVSGVLDLVLLTILLITPYRAVVGGAHFKTHVKCVLATSIFYISIALIGKYVLIEKKVTYLLAILIWGFSMLMITWYAPADTEDVPILRKKERKIKKVLSYIIMSIMIIVALAINNRIITNILLFGVLFQTISTTKVMYRIAGNKYGYEEVYKANSKS